MKPIAAALGLSLVTMALSAPPLHDTRTHVGTAAMTSEASVQRRPRRPRIEVYPSRRLYRHCIDWYAVERRPSGAVIVPYQRCWWALRAPA